MSQYRFHQSLLAAALCAVALSATAERAATDANAVPHLNDRGRQAYREYLKAEMHRAFAIGPGGAWAWKGDLDTPEEAGAAAIQACETEPGERCALYALNDDVVLDERLWVTLWGPYATAEQAARAPEGRLRGQRFPDLLFTNPSGKPLPLSGLRGKVVVLHFWGTWCPPCVHELPQFEKLRASLASTPDVVFVFSQVREPADTARRWLAQRGLNLPLYDSGSHTSQDSRLRLRDGSKIADRVVAPVFPTTYVLDRHGIVVFQLHGSAPDWSQYIGFLRDVAAGSK